MKKIILLICLISLFILSSCRKQEGEIINNSVNIEESNDKQADDAVYISVPYEENDEVNISLPYEDNNKENSEEDNKENDEVNVTDNNDADINAYIYEEIIYEDSNTVNVNDENFEMSNETELPEITEEVTMEFVNNENHSEDTQNDSSNKLDAGKTDNIITDYTEFPFSDDNPIELPEM